MCYVVLGKWFCSAGSPEFFAENTVNLWTLKPKQYAKNSVMLRVTAKTSDSFQLQAMPFK